MLTWRQGCIAASLRMLLGCEFSNVEHSGSHMIVPGLTAGYILAQTAFESRLDLADEGAGDAAAAEYSTSLRRLTELREEVARCCEF